MPDNQGRCSVTTLLILIKTCEILSLLDASQPELTLRVGPGLLPLAAALSVVWDMACHSHKADVCMNCQKETETTLWRVEGRVRKKKATSERTSGGQSWSYDAEKCIYFFHLFFLKRRKW